MSEYIVRTNGTTNYNIRVGLIQGVSGKSNYIATTAPGITDDLNSGYMIGSNWYNLTTDKAYTCLDYTVGAAVWKEITPAVVEGESGNVTNGDNHDHSGGDGAQISYNNLSNLPNYSGTYQAKDTVLDALSGITAASDTAPYFTSSGTASSTTFTSLARSLVAGTSTSAMRATLEITSGGVTAYSDLTGIPETFDPSEHSADHSATYQGLDTNLTALAGLTGASDTYAYFTGDGSMTTGTITSAGRSLIDDSSTSSMRTTLGIDDIATKKSNLSASTPPGIGDGTALGYSVGSYWVDTTADKAYICVDSTLGAAVWKEITYISVGGSVDWGSIGGTLSSQTDLSNALAAKQTKAASTTTGNFPAYTDASGTEGDSTYGPTSFQARHVNLTAASAVPLAANTMLYSTASDTMASTTFTSTARTLMDDSSTSSMRTTLGIDDIATKKSNLSASVAPIAGDNSLQGYAVGSFWFDTIADKGYVCLDATEGAGVWREISPVNYSSTYQGLDTELTAIAGLTSASDTAPYFTGSGTASLMTVTSAARTLLDDASTMIMRTTMGTNALHGFENRIASTLAMSGSNFQITTGTTYNVWIEGTKYTYTTTQEVAISNERSLHYVYFNASGVLTASTVPWDILGNFAFVAMVYKSGSIYAIGDERHSHTRDRNWHKWAHDTLFARYESGGDATFTNSTFSITRFYIHDEDIDIDSGATKTACSLWYRYTGATAMTLETNISTPYKATAGVLQYDNGGTLAPVSSNNFVCNYVYFTNDINYPVYIVVGQNNHNTISLARAEAQPTLIGLPTMEWKIAYRVIYKNVGGDTPTYQESADNRTTSNAPTGVPSVVNASSVITAAGAFSGSVLDSGDGNAQLAFESLDTYLDTRKTRSFGITIGDGTTVPSTGSKGFITVGFAGTIVSWYITANASGSCVVDLKRSGTTIIGSGNKPTLATAQRANALANSSWTSKVVTKYDEFEFNLDSVATCTRITVVFFVEI